MQTLEKVFTIQQDLIFLDSIGGPVFDERYSSFVYYMNNFYLVYIFLLLFCRQYFKLAHRVEDEARRIGDVCNLRMLGDSDSSSSTSPIPLPSTHLPTLVPGDLKRLFSIQQKALGAVSYDHQVTYCKSWLSLLSSLGIELLRKPNPLILSDLTKLEASTLAYQLIDQKKKRRWNLATLP